MKNWIHSETNKSNIVLTSKVSLSRNLKDVKFLKKLDEEDARHIVNDIYDKTKRYDELEDFTLIKSWETNEYDINGYIDKQFVGNPFLDRRGQSALIVNKEETLVITINEEDHLKMQGVTAGLNLENSYKEVDRLDNYMEKELSYEFNSDYGYLTSSINNLGTGMKVSVIMHLPMLSINKKIDNILQEGNKFIKIRPIFKGGRLYEVSNNITLGIKEEEIIDSVQNEVCNIIKQEKSAREVLMSGDMLRLEDKVFRALGILRYARIISSKESLELLSNIRLGVEMDILDVKNNQINTALIESRDSVIQGSLKEILTKEELDLKRAEIIRNIIT